MGRRSTVYAPRNVAATSQPLATAAALEVMQQGGNAIDGAVAAAAVLNVTEPHMTGMGGDAFSIVWWAETGELHGIDASGRSGSGMSVEALRARGHDRVPGSGPEAVTVPGAVSGWHALVERFGKLTLAEVLQPAIRIASEGFPVTPVIARQWAGATEKLARDEGARATYLIDGERAPRAGEWHTNPDIARSFQRIADEGPGVLYGGSLGQDLVDGLAELGGFLTLEDLATHQQRWVEPLSTDFRGFTVWELPPAGQGIAALEMLELLEPMDLEGMGHNSADYLHHLIEVKKLAFADLHRYVSDADHMEIDPMSLLNPSYIDARRALIDPRVAADRVNPGRAVTDSETIYLSVADADGNMVSFINSVFSGFGSGVVIPGTGFALQNRGAGFVFDDGHPNQVAPRKRPFHTIIPGFVTRDGEPLMAFGLMGGSMQPQGHTQLLLNMLVFGMDPQEAVDAARFRHLSGKRVAIERISDEVGADLEARGHELADWTRTDFGGAQVILRLEKGWAAASEPRKDGHAAGN
ncbi:MAG: gamma-glutamyltransferase [Gemmatimonadetes bacterium]|nr:gamma-glutamyltransferase [Gemmatimonadota bacterium]MYG22762.1 gamma-glutamyltransferase [Gemmatimonadota bacterium]MYJ40101.1 gamma-glutamyltransferase [Gemmatimonadota bacterium]